MPKGKRAELRAVATVIEQPGSGKFAIVGCDVLFLTREMVDRCTAQIEKSCGILPANILINATHTHSAPSTVRIHGARPSPNSSRTWKPRSSRRSRRPTPGWWTIAAFYFTWGKSPTSAKTAGC